MKMALFEHERNPCSKKATAVRNAQGLPDSSRSQSFGCERRKIASREGVKDKPASAFFDAELA